MSSAAARSLLAAWDAGTTLDPALFPLTDPDAGLALQTEIMELEANPTIAAEGVVLEAYLDKGRGVVANVLAAPVSDPDQIRKALVEQVTGMVRWTECVGWLAGEGGVTQLVELGSGKVLSGLAKRIAPDVPAVSVGTAADVDAFVAGLGA